MANIREKYLETFTANLLKAVEITKAKGADYAGDEDTFKNFRASAEAGSIPGKEPITVEQTILVRLADKDSRIKNLLGRPDMQGEVADEKIEDTLLDRLIYTNILLTWLQLGRPEVGTIFEEPEQIPLPLVEDTSTKNALNAADIITDKVTKLFNWGARKIKNS